MGGPIRFAYLHEAPVVFNDERALEFIGGAWRELHIADACCKARLISEQEFNQMVEMDRAPPYPRTVFE